MPPSASKFFGGVLECRPPWRRTTIRMPSSPAPRRLTWIWTFVLQPVPLDESLCQAMNTAGASIGEVGRSKSVGKYVYHW